MSRRLTTLTYRDVTNSDIWRSLFNIDWSCDSVKHSKTLVHPPYSPFVCCKTFKRSTEEQTGKQETKLPLLDEDPCHLLHSSYFASFQTTSAVQENEQNYVFTTHVLNWDAINDLVKRVYSPSCSISPKHCLQELTINNKRKRARRSYFRLVLHYDFSLWHIDYLHCRERDRERESPQFPSCSGNDKAI